MECDMMEVLFDEFCITCKYRDLPEEDEPCRECLDYPENLYSRKPVCYKPEE